MPTTELLVHWLCRPEGQEKKNWEISSEVLADVITVI